MLFSRGRRFIRVRVPVLSTSLSRLCLHLLNLSLFFYSSVYVVQFQVFLPFFLHSWISVYTLIYCMAAVCLCKFYIYLAFYLSLFNFFIYFHNLFAFPLSFSISLCYLRIYVCSSIFTYRAVYLSMSTYLFIEISLCLRLLLF